MRVAGFIKSSVVNGEGIRDVIFVQGCPHHCKGCHNPHTWDFFGGTEMTPEEIRLELADSCHDVTISGGEPMVQPDLERLIWILQADKKDIWLYTGYRFEDIPMDVWESLWWAGLNVVVDGRYEADKRDLTLQFRGSSNQRIINLKRTLEENKVVLWEGKRERNE